MKKGVILFVLVSLLACSKRNRVEYDKDSIFGNWKEYEAYVDPGDGSGTFHAFDGIQLTINPDSTYSCSPETSYAWGKNGRITRINDSTLHIYSNQSTTAFPARFRLSNDLFEIYYFCIEGCGSRFKRINAD
jgi:hypothetical protein